MVNVYIALPAPDRTQLDTVLVGYLLLRSVYMKRIAFQELPRIEIARKEVVCCRVLQHVPAW